MLVVLKHNPAASRRQNNMLHARPHTHISFHVRAVRMSSSHARMLPLIAMHGRSKKSWCCCCWKLFHQFDHIFCCWLFAGSSSIAGVAGIAAFQRLHIWLINVTSTLLSSRLSANKHQRTTSNRISIFHRFHIRENQFILKLLPVAYTVQRSRTNTYSKGCKKHVPANENTCTCLGIESG